jgi:hypothetical protein
VNSFILPYFKKNILKITSKEGLLTAWEEAAFENLVNSFILPYFKKNILKITSQGAY